MKITQGKKSILVIDDETSILKLIERVLSRKGYAVDTAESGEEGIQKIDNHKYALVLTDIKMPGISGDQVLEYIKDNLNTAIPVIGMSGTPWLLDQVRFDAVLPKPHSMAALIDIIEELTQSSFP